MNTPLSRTILPPGPHRKNAPQITSLYLLPLGQIAPQITLARGNGQMARFQRPAIQLLTATNPARPDWVATGAPLPGVGGLFSANVPIASEPQRFFRL